MGKMIEVAIESSMLALMGRDVEAAKQVAKNDEAINEMERDIEAQCMKLLLQQQPMATDLRLITAALKMITDMERIGDHAVDVADLVLNVPDCKYGKMNEIIELSTEIIHMLHEAVQSYIQKDYNKAKNVIAHDDVIDDLYHAIKTDLVQKIRGNQRRRNNSGLSSHSKIYRTNWRPRYKYCGVGNFCTDRRKKMYPTLKIMELFICKLFAGVNSQDFKRYL